MMSPRFAVPLLLLAAPALAHATGYTWPDVAPPCNTATLQDCINAVAANDVVNVQTSAPLDIAFSFLEIAKPLTLRAAPGYRPVLPAGKSIVGHHAATAGSNWGIHIEGFTLLDGAVEVRNDGGNATISLRRMDINSQTPASWGGSGGTTSTGIGLRNNSSGTLDYELAESRVQVATATVSQPTGIYLDSNGGGAVTGRIHDNRLRAGGVQALRGIALYPQGASTTRVYANQIGGNVANGITIFPGNAAFAHQFDVVGNAVDCNGAQGYPVGIAPVRSVDGSLSLQVFNNTVVGCYGGLSVGNAGSAGPISGRIANNLIAYNTYGLGLGSLGANISNDHNLLFGNTSNNYTPGPGTVTSDPLLRRGKDDARLTTGSPAIDAADSTALRNLLAADAIGEIDADGLRRFKGASSLADIGAFEFGDVSLAHRVTNGSSVSPVNHPALNAQDQARPLSTSTRMRESYQAVTTPYRVGFQYFAPNWRLLTENGSGFVLGSAYNVLAPGAGAGVLLHSSSAGNQAGFGTLLNDAYLNNQPNRIVLAAHRLGSTFDHPLAASYAFGNWVLWQGDTITGQLFPNGLDFHVYAQDPSLNAFHWDAPETGNTTYTVLDQVVINGEPCASIQALPGYGAGSSGNQTSGGTRSVGLRYVSALKRWRIENLDGALMDANADFYVVVDEAATAACRYDHIFHDEFEVRD